MNLFAKSKKLVAIILSLSAVLAVLCIPPVNAYAYDQAKTPAQGDIAAIYIYTDSHIGREEYVGCTIVAVDKAGGEYSTITDELATIKVRGNSTSSGPKKPYNFKFDKKTNLFGMGKAKKWSLIANLYDKTLMRNKLVYDFARAIGMEYVVDCMYVDVYLNGIYVGNYLLTEAVEIGETRVDINEEQNDVLLELEPYEGYSNPICFRTPHYGILLGYNDPDDPTPEMMSFVENFFDSAESALSTKNKANIEKYFNIQSFIDNYIVQEYFKNVDFNTSSTRYYIKNGVLYAGPVWDFDLSSGNCSSSYYSAYNNVGGSGKSYEGIYCNKQWYSVLLNCSWFTKMLYDRYMELQDKIINLYADNVLGTNQIDYLISQNKTSFDRNFSEAGWDIGTPYSILERLPDPTYKENVEYLRNWLYNRNIWLINRFIIASGSNYKIDGMYIKNVGGYTYTTEFLSYIKSSVTVLRNSEPMSDDFICTGDVVKTTGPSYEVVVTGDINGDGRIGVVDYMAIRLDMLGTVKLDGAYKTAADIDGNGSVSVSDYVALRMKLLGIQ